jgi:Tfp pilus assembly protein PilV
MTNQKDFTIIVLIILIIVLVGVLGYVVLVKMPTSISNEQQEAASISNEQQETTSTSNEQQETTSASNEQQETTSTSNKMPVSDLCIVEKDKIIDLINTFERAQIEGDVSRVLSLFTPPEQPDDVSFYDFLSGSDAAAPRLYNSGLTNFQESSFKILDVPTKNVSGSCVTKVEEQRAYYPEGVGGDFGSTQPSIVYFVTVKQNNIWKIDKYLSDLSGIESMHKYSGWGY